MTAAADAPEQCVIASREFGLGFVDLREAAGKNVMNWDAAQIADARRVLQRFDLRVACIASPIFKVDWPGAPKSSFSPARDEFGASFTYEQQQDLLERAFDLAKTFGTDVRLSASVFTLPRSSSATPRSVNNPGFSGPRKPMARNTRSAGQTFSLPGTSCITGRPFCTFHSTFTVCRAFTFPAPSSTKRLVTTAYFRGSLPNTTAASSCP